VGVAVVAAGEPLIATAAEQYLRERLTAAGIAVIGVADVPGLGDLPGSGEDLPTASILERLQGLAAGAVIVHATYLGSRPLTYMGRTEDAYQSRLQVLALDPADGRPLAPEWTGTVEYTHTRTDRSAARVLGPAADRLVQALDAPRFHRR